MNGNKETMVTVEEAIERILGSIEPLRAETVSILDATGRVLYEDAISHFNVPPLDNSAMDGYAIIAESTAHASEEHPVALTVVDEIKAGGDLKATGVKANTAIRIMTGAPIPDGADSVIEMENTREDGDRVLIFNRTKKGDNIRYAGEDIKKGSIVLNRGDRLKSSDIGLLASLNIDAIQVYSRPRVAIVSTGDEIVGVGEEIKAGQIRNSSYYTLYSEIQKYNSIPEYLGIARDTKDDVRDKLIKALEYDAIITTGGVSMGKYDFIKDAITELGMEILIEKIKMKPGKPCIFGKKGNKLFFGLPGNPVSTLVSFIQFVRPALLRLMGSKRIDKPLVNAVLEGEIRKKPEREHFVRGYFTIRDGNFYVNTTGPQGSGILRSMSIANCLIIIPIGVERVKDGDVVTIQLINHGEV
jgi:molybdopterin molybdotransferase